MFSFEKTESNFLTFTQKQIAQQLVYSDSSIKTYRDQLNMPSACNTKETERKRVSYQDGPTALENLETSNCENEMRFFFWYRFN